MTARAPTHVYVYYRIASAVAPAHVGNRVRSMQAGLKMQTGIDGRLMRRADDTGTWMEVYEGVNDREGFMAALEAAVLAHGIEALLESGSARHAEFFIEAA